MQPRNPQKISSINKNSRVGKEIYYKELNSTLNHITKPKSQIDNIFPVNHVKKKKKNGR